MIYNRNGEGYSDPTAGEAIANIRREERLERRKALNKEKDKKASELNSKEDENGRI